MSGALSIPRRFNGPLESGNGGYCSGVVAGFLEGAAEVSLRRPVPLDTPLDVVRGSDGSVRVSDGEALAPVVAGEEHIVIAWPIETDGRKRHAGSAVLSPDGEPLAVARGLLIEPRRG